MDTQQTAFPTLELILSTHQKNTELKSIMGLSKVFKRDPNNSGNDILGNLGILATTETGEGARYTCTGDTWMKWGTNGLLEKGNGLSSFLGSILFGLNAQSDFEYVQNQILNILGKDENALTKIAEGVQVKMGEAQPIVNEESYKPSHISIQDVVMYMADNHKEVQIKIHDDDSLFATIESVEVHYQDLSYYADAIHLVNDCYQQAYKQAMPNELLEAVRKSIHNLTKSAANKKQREHEASIEYETQQAFNRRYEKNDADKPQFKEFAETMDTSKMKIYRPFLSENPIKLFEGQKGEQVITPSVKHFISSLSYHDKSGEVGRLIQWDKNKKIFIFDGIIPISEDPSAPIKTEFGNQGLLEFIADKIPSSKHHFEKALNQAAVNTLLENVDKNSLLTSIQEQSNIFKKIPSAFSFNREQRWENDSFVISIHTEKDTGKSRWYDYKDENALKAEKKWRAFSSLELFKHITGLDGAEARKGMIDLISLGNIGLIIEEGAKTSKLSNELQKTELFKKLTPLAAPKEQAHFFKEYMIQKRGISEDSYSEMLESGRIYHGLYNHPEKGDDIPVIVFLPESSKNVRFAAVRSIDKELNGSKLTPEREFKGAVFGSDGGNQFSFALGQPQWAKEMYAPSKRHSFAFVEAPLDGLSYQNIFPLHNVVTQNGLNTKTLINSLKAFFGVVQTESDYPEFIYACDNTESRYPGFALPGREELNDKSGVSLYKFCFNQMQNQIGECTSLEEFTKLAEEKGLSEKSIVKALGEYRAELQKTDDTILALGRAAFCLYYLEQGLDKASYKTLTNLRDEMAEFCLEKFSEQYPDIHHQNWSELSKALESVLILPHSHIEKCKTVYEDSLESNRDHKQASGAVLFSVFYEQPGLFKVATPSSKEYGNYKDWNDLLLAGLKVEKKLTPSFTDRAIHAQVAATINQEQKNELIPSQNFENFVGVKLEKKEISSGLNQPSFSVHLG